LDTVVIVLKIGNMMAAGCGGRGGKKPTGAVAPLILKYPTSYTQPLLG
jgi:hypothetical protein